MNPDTEFSMPSVSRYFESPVWVVVDSARLWAEGLPGGLGFADLGAEKERPCLILFDTEVHAEKAISQMGVPGCKALPLHGSALLEGLLAAVLEYQGKNVRHLARYNPADPEPYAVAPIETVLKALEEERLGHR